jgi:hypothetical protein
MTLAKTQRHPEQEESVRGRSYRAVGSRHPGQRRADFPSVEFLEFWKGLACPSTPQI